MNVLVTGGAGFIGSHTVDELVHRGYRVRVLDSLDPRVHPTGRPPYLTGDIELVEGSVTDRDMLERALDGIDSVFHLAAYQDYMTDFHRFVHVNTESTALLYEIALEKRLALRRVVLASSQSVAGEGRYRCPAHGVVYPGPRSLEQLRRGEWDVRCPQGGEALEPLLIDEATANPHTAYGISKYAVELLGLRLGRRYGVETTCMRYTYVQGPRNSFYNAYSGVLRRFALQVMHGIAPTVYEDGAQIRDYVNVSDVARANILALEHPEAAWQIFNVGGGRGITVLHLARIVLTSFGSDLEPAVRGEFRLGDTRHTVSDISRIRGLGWRPTVRVEQSVADYRDWITSQRGTKDFLLQAERMMHEAGVVQRVEAPAG